MIETGLQVADGNGDRLYGGEPVLEVGGLWSVGMIAKVDSDSGAVWVTFAYGELDGKLGYPVSIRYDYGSDVVIATDQQVMNAQ